MPLKPKATDLPSRSLASSPSLASPVRRILELDEELDITSRLEEARAVPALSSSSSASSGHSSCTCKEELQKLFQAMDRMEKMLERIASRQQKSDAETKAAYTTVSTGISYLRGQVTAGAQPTAPTAISTNCKTIYTNKEKTPVNLYLNPLCQKFRRNNKLYILIF